MKYKLLRAILFACALSLAVLVNAIAQDSLFQRVIVGNRVTLEVPSHWHVRDINERKNIAAAAEALRDPGGEKNEGVHVSALSVVSLPQPVGAIIRVSFLPTEGLSREEIQNEIKNNRTQMLQVFAKELQKDNALRRNLEKGGTPMLGKEEFGTETIGGLIAMTINYRRQSALGQSAFNVTQYHIHTGEEMVLISLSYRESDKRLFGPILDRVKRSVAIK